VEIRTQSPGKELHIERIENNNWARESKAHSIPSHPGSSRQEHIKFHGLNNESHYPVHHENVNYTHQQPSNMRVSRQVASGHHRNSEVRKLSHVAKGQGTRIMN